MKHSGLVPLFLTITCSLGNFQSGQSLKIQVVDVDGGRVEKEFSDSSAAFQERSYLLPTKRRDAIQGPLIYPNPRNACSTVDPPPNDTYIAFLEEYVTCSGDSEANLQGAGFSAFIAFSSDKSAFLVRKRVISQALFFDANFASYLEDNVLQTLTANASLGFEVVIWDDSFAKLEQLFIIFGAILLVAVFLSICVFCFSLCCRMAVVRWRTRGLSNWQVRALPKRKFRHAKESMDTCSICLEEFKEGETVRVLPCDHVFHPKCVDEWLSKWNRTCPLCKSTIKRKGGRTHNPPAHTDDNEASSLLPQEERVSFGGGADGRGYDYGTTGNTSILHRSGSNRAHHRGGSGSSNCSSGTTPAGNTNQVTSADIELSTGTTELEMSGGSNRQGRSSSPASLYETPLNSDLENTPSYTTANSGNTEQV